MADYISADEAPGPKVCPGCAKEIAEGVAVVRGSASFCSLDCVAVYHAAELSERARRLAASARN